MQEVIRRFKEHQKKMQAYSHAQNILYYDARTAAPKNNVKGLSATLEVLSEEEKTELLHKAKAGDMNARNRLVEGNLRLVLSVIQRFAGRCDSMDDLFQVGVIGLIKAIDNFNTDLNVRFSTYAVPMTYSSGKKC